MSILVCSLSNFLLNEHDDDDDYYYYYYYNRFTAPWIFSGTTRVSRYQKGKTNQESKTNLDLLEQEIVSGSGISWAICKSAPHPGQITTPGANFTNDLTTILRQFLRQFLRLSL